MINWTGNAFSTLPEVVPRTPDRRSAYGKQLVVGDGPESAAPYVHKEAVWNCAEQDVRDDFPERASQSDDNKAPQTVRTRGRKILIWTACLIVLLVLLGVGLGVGLGGVFGKSSESSNSRHPQIDSNSDGNNVTTPTEAADAHGAFAGTGLAACLLQWSSNLSWPTKLMPNQSSLLLFYQHHSGDIRFMANPLPGDWFGGTPDDTVATDAKLGTPIAIRCPGPSDLSGLSLFYINKDNVLRQRAIDNLTHVWTDGLLNKLDVRMFDSDHVGLSAGFYAGTIGDVDLTGTPAYSGIRLWAATTETTFAQYSWRPGLTEWHYDQTWQGMNGAAAPAMFGWGIGHTTYVMFVDQNNDVKMYWEDTAVNVVSTDAHRINTWTQSSISIPNVDPTAGLNYRGNLYGRVAESGTIQGWNMTFEAENSTIGSTKLSEVAGPPGAAGTRVVALTYPPAGNYENVFVFYQEAEQNDIVLSTGVVATGAWNTTRLPIPDS